MKLRDGSFRRHHWPKRLLLHSARRMLPSCASPLVFSPSCTSMQSWVSPRRSWFSAKTHVCAAAREELHSHTCTDLPALGSEVVSCIHEEEAILTVASIEAETAVSVHLDLARLIAANGPVKSDIPADVAVVVASPDRQYIA